MATSKRQPPATGDYGTLRAEARTALKKVAAKYHDSTTEITETTNRDNQLKIGIGTLVRVSTLNVEGTVQSIDGTDADIEVDGKRLRVGLNSLRTVTQSRVVSDVNPHVTTNVRTQTTTLHELNLIGCRVDEALSRVEKHVDQALMSEQRTVRFIHGHGTGQLREAIGGFLDTHPLVTRVTTAPPEEGGRGVTIAELKE